MKTIEQLAVEELRQRGRLQREAAAWAAQEPVIRERAREKFIEYVREQHGVEIKPGQVQLDLAGDGSAWDFMPFTFHAQIVFNGGGRVIRWSGLLKAWFDHPEEVRAEPNEFVDEWTPILNGNRGNRCRSLGDAYIWTITDSPDADPDRLADQIEELIR